MDIRQAWKNWLERHPGLIGLSGRLTDRGRELQEAHADGYMQGYVAGGNGRLRDVEAQRDVALARVERLGEMLREPTTGLCPHCNETIELAPILPPVVAHRERP